jgi:hypothetical protein
LGFQATFGSFEAVPCERHRWLDVDQVRIPRLLSLVSAFSLFTNHNVYRDLAVYQDTFASFGIAAVNDRFDMLRQLGNLFIVQPDILRSYMSESYLARIEPSLLRPYLVQRADYGDYPRRFWDEVVGGGNGAATAGGSYGQQEVVDAVSKMTDYSSRITARLGALTMDRRERERDDGPVSPGAYPMAVMM